MDLKRVSSKEPKKAVNLKFKTNDLVHPDTPRKPGRFTPAPEINDDDSGCCESLPVECRMKNKPSTEEASSSQTVFPQESNGQESNDITDSALQSVRQTAGGGRMGSQPMNVRSPERVSSAGCERTFETPPDSPHQSRSTASFLKHSSNRIENPPAENAAMTRKQLVNSSYEYPKGETKTSSAQKERSSSEKPIQEVNTTVKYPACMSSSSVMQRHKPFQQTIAPMPELPPQLQLEPSSFPIVPPAPMMESPPASPIAPPPKSPNVQQHPNVPENPPTPRLEKERARSAAKSPYPQPPTKSSRIPSLSPQNNRSFQSPGPNTYQSRSVSPNYFPPVSPSFHPLSPMRPLSRPDISYALYPPPHCLIGAPSPMRPPSVVDTSYEPMMFPTSGPQSLGMSPQRWSTQSPGSFSSYGNSPSYPFSDPYGPSYSMSNIMSPDIGRLSRASSAGEDPHSFNSHHYNEDIGRDKNNKRSSQLLSPSPADWGGESDFGNCVETVRRWRLLADDFRNRSPPSEPNAELCSRANSPVQFVPVSAPSERGPESTRIWVCNKDQKSKEVTASNDSRNTELSAGMNSHGSSASPNPVYADNSSAGENRIWNDQSMPSHWKKMPGIGSQERSPGEWRLNQYPNNKPTEEKSQEMYPSPQAKAQVRNKIDAPALFDFDSMPSSSVPLPQPSTALMGMSSTAPDTSCHPSSFSYPSSNQWMENNEKSSNRSASPSCQSPRFAMYPPPKSWTNATDTNEPIHPSSPTPMCKSPGFSNYPSPKECLESNEKSSGEPDSSRSSCKSSSFPAYPPPKQEISHNEPQNEAEYNHWNNFRQSTQLADDENKAGPQSYEKSNPSFISGRVSSRSEGRPTSTGFRFDTDDRGIQVDSPPIVCTPRGGQDQRRDLIKPMIISQKASDPQSRDKALTTKKEQNEQQQRDSKGNVMRAISGDSEMQTPTAKPAGNQQEVVHQENEQASLSTYPSKTQCQQPKFYQTPLQQKLQEEQQKIHQECQNQLEMEHNKKLREIEQRKQSEKEKKQLGQNESLENAYREIPSGRKTPCEREFKMPGQNAPMLWAQENQQPQIYQYHPYYPQQYWQQQRQMQQQQMWQMQQQHFSNFQRPQYNQYPRFLQPELQKQQQQSDQFQQRYCKPQKSRQSLVAEEEMQPRDQQKPLHQEKQEQRHQEQTSEQKQISHTYFDDDSLIQQNPEEKSDQQEDKLGQQQSRTLEEQKEQPRQFQETQNEQRLQEKCQDFQEQYHPDHQYQAFQQQKYFPQEAFNQQPYNQFSYHQLSCHQQPRLQQALQHQLQQFQQQQQFPQPQSQNQFKKLGNQPMATCSPGINKYDYPMCEDDLMKRDVKEKQNEILQSDESCSEEKNKPNERECQGQVPEQEPKQQVQDQNETQKSSFNTNFPPAQQPFPPQTPHWHNFLQQEQFQGFQEPMEHTIQQSMQQLTEKPSEKSTQQSTLQTPLQFPTPQVHQEQMTCPPQQQIKFLPPSLQNYSLPEDQEKLQPMHFPLQQQFEVPEKTLKKSQQPPVQYPSQQWHPTQEQISIHQQHHHPQEPPSSPRQQMHCSNQQQLRIPQDSFKCSSRQMQNSGQQEYEHPEEPRSNAKCSAQQQHHDQKQLTNPRPPMQYPSHHQHSHESLKSPTQEMKQLQQPPHEKLNSPADEQVKIIQQQQRMHLPSVQQQQQSEDQTKSPSQVLQTELHHREQQKRQNIQEETPRQEIQFQLKQLQQHHPFPKQYQLEQVQGQQLQYCERTHLQQETQTQESQKHKQSQQQIQYLEMESLPQLQQHQYQHQQFDQKSRAYNDHQNKRKEANSYWELQGTSTSAAPQSHREIHNKQIEPCSSKNSENIKGKTIMIEKGNVGFIGNTPVSNEVMSGNQNQYVTNYSSGEPQIPVDKKRIDGNEQSKSAETTSEARLQSLRQNLLLEFLVPKAVRMVTEQNVPIAQETKPDFDMSLKLTQGKIHEENSPRSIASDISYDQGIRLASGHQEQWLIEHQVQPRQTDLNEFVREQVEEMVASQSIKTAESKESNTLYLSSYHIASKEETDPESESARRCISSQSSADTILTLHEPQPQTSAYRISSAPCQTEESMHPAAGDALIIHTPSNTHISDNILSQNNRSPASNPPTSPRENSLIPMLDIQRLLSIKSSQSQVDQEYSQKSLSSQSHATDDLGLDSHRSLQSRESITTSRDKIASPSISEKIFADSASSIINEKFEEPRSISVAESHHIPLPIEKSYEDRLREMKQSDINSLPMSNIQTLSSRLSEMLAEAERVMRKCQTPASNSSSTSPMQSYSGQNAELRSSCGETNRAPLIRGETFDAAKERKFKEWPNEGTNNYLNNLREKEIKPMFVMEPVLSKHELPETPTDIENDNKSTLSNFIQSPMLTECSPKKKHGKSKSNMSSQSPRQVVKSPRAKEKQHQYGKTSPVMKTEGNATQNAERHNLNNLTSRLNQKCNGSARELSTGVEQASGGFTLPKDGSKAEQEQDVQERVVLPAEKILALLANIRKERGGKDKKM